MYYIKFNKILYDMVKAEYIVFLVAAVLIVNTYYDGRLMKMFQSNQKWMKMAMFAFAGLSLFLFLRRNPENSRQLMYHANDIIKYMPISKGTADMITPFFDMTGVSPPNDDGAMSGASGGSASGGSAIGGASSGAIGRAMSSAMGVPSSQGGGGGSAGERRILNSGKNSSKRSVSETKKKYVAAQQGWKCGDCQRQLPAWFEVDHVIALEHGGSNHVDNLVALCRDCHGKKTAMSFL
jgi:hypothetical protein